MGLRQLERPRSSYGDDHPNDRFQRGDRGAQEPEFHVWDVGGQDKFSPVWHHYCQGTNGLIYVVDSNDRNRVEEAKVELNKMNEDCAWRLCSFSANALTPSTATHLGKKLTDVRKNGDLWWWYAGRAGGDRTVAGCKVHVPEWMVHKADVGKERRSKAGAWSRRWQNDVSAGRNAASGGVAAGLMDSGGVGVALPCASAKHSRLFPEVFLMTARMLVAGSLLV